MFARKPRNDSGLTEIINTLQDRMLKTDVESDAFHKMADQLSKFYKLKELEATPRRVKPDTLALIAGNLVGIVLILNYEKAGIVTSKALSFVLRAR